MSPCGIGYTENQDSVTHHTEAETAGYSFSQLVEVEDISFSGVGFEIFEENV
jgi:hypothetical protein